MKIHPNATFLSNVAGPAPLVPAKKTASIDKSAPELPAVADKARLVSPPPLLPSVKGDFDAARVAQIRASISAGSYPINTDKIADGLLATVRDLLSTRAP